MNCEQVEELIGAYALDALPRDEMLGVREHLASCPEQAAKAAELRLVAASLQLDVEEMAPPPALRNRIVGAVARSGSASPALEPSAREPIAFGQRYRERTPFWTRPALAFGALAAGLAIAVAGLLAWNLEVRGGDSAAGVTAVRPLMQGTGATAGYVVVFDDAEAAIVGEALPRLDPSQAYQLWSLDELGIASSLGLMRYDASGVAVATVSLHEGAAGTDRVAITIEPAAGSEQPTSAPLYVADL